MVSDKDAEMDKMKMPTYQMEMQSMALEDAMSRY